MPSSSSSNEVSAVLTLLRITALHSSGCFSAQLGFICADTGLCCEEKPRCSSPLLDVPFHG